MRACWKLLLYGAFIIMISKVKNARKNTERLKFHDFNICPNILHADADHGGIAIALLHWSAGAIKRVFVKNETPDGNNVQNWLFLI